MADEYIKREDALAKPFRFYWRNGSLSNPVVSVKNLKDIPAADVVPVVRGKWIKRVYYRKSTQAYDCEMYSCSECGNELSYDAETGMRMCNWGFCPNCGAKMDGGEA